jgi:hypothetical protein
VTGENAYYVTSKDNGEHFSAPIQINSEANTVHPANSYRGPDLALGAKDRVHVIWYINAYQRKLPQDQWGVLYSHIDPGQTAFASPRNLNHKPSDNYSLAANERGDVAVVWKGDKMMLTLSRDNGETFPKTEPLKETDGCECCATRALYSKEGALLVQYREKANNMRDMHLLALVAGGKDFTNQKISTTPWQINACPMSGSFLAQGRKNLVGAWETKGQIFFARLDGKSTPMEVSAAPQGKWPVALEGPDGTVLVSWKSGSNLWWQLFDRDNKKIGAAKSKPSPNTTRFAGVLARDGSFVLLD